MVHRSEARRVGVGLLSPCLIRYYLSHVTTNVTKRSISGISLRHNFDWDTRTTMMMYGRCLMALAAVAASASAFVPTERVIRPVTELHGNTKIAPR
jgi:hypothetical protein